MDIMDLLTKVNDLDSNENFGFVPPTGSTIQFNIFLQIEYFSEMPEFQFGHNLC